MIAFSSMDLWVMGPCWFREAGSGVSSLQVNVQQQKEEIHC